MPNGLPKGAGIDTDNSIIPPGMKGLAAADARQRNPNFRRDIDLDEKPAKPATAPAAISSPAMSVMDRAIAATQGIRDRLAGAAQTGVKKMIANRKAASTDKDAATQKSPSKR